MQWDADHCTLNCSYCGYQQESDWVRIAFVVAIVLVIVAIVIYLVSQGESTDALGLLTLWGVS